MKNKLLILFLAMLSFYYTQAQVWVTIPDPNFVAWLNTNGFDTCMNGNQIDETCPAVLNEVFMDCSSSNISNLAGIEAFSNLQDLYCGDNQINDIAQLPPNLILLACYQNQLTSLPTLPSSLNYLYCYQNQLTSLPALPSSISWIYCNQNQLTSLPTLPASLVNLQCNQNLLTYLPFLPPSVNSLICFDNQIDSITNLPNTLNVFLVDSNPNLSQIPPLANFTGGNNGYFDISGTRINCLPNMISHTGYIPAIDTMPICGVIIPDSNFVSWLYYNGYCIYGNILDTACSSVLNATSINCSTANISDLTGIQYFKNLNQLTCTDNQLTNLPKLPSLLTYLDCTGNQLSILPDSLPSTLSTLKCSHNQLIRLPDSLPGILSFLDCSQNHLDSIPKLPNSLKFLSCAYNSMLTLPMLPDSLTSLYCNGNQLTSLQTLPNSLTIIDCSNNRLASLPALPNSLSYFSCGNNPNLNNMQPLLYFTGGTGDFYVAGGTQITCLPNVIAHTGYIPAIDTMPICGFTPASLSFYSTFNNNINPPQLLSSSTIYLKPTFKLCADGSSVSIFKYKSDTIPLNRLKFQLLKSHLYDYDQSISGGFVNGYSIEYQLIDTLLTAVFTHPSRFNILASSNNLNVQDTIQVIDTLLGLVVYSNPVEIYRAPIVFVHGLMADSGTFRQMSNSLMDAGLYPPYNANNRHAGSPLIYRVDYKATHGDHFSTNANVVPKGIDEVFNQAQAQGYSCGKAIIAGHSMGGILARLYLQSDYSTTYRNDIEKLITINTPHYGTQLPDYGLALSNNSFVEANAISLLVQALGGGPVLGLSLQQTATSVLHEFLISHGAIVDLSSKSEAITEILDIPVANQIKVPSVTLSTNEVGDNSLSAILARGVLYPAIHSHDIYRGDVNDLIVPLKSQQCGIFLEPTISGQFHSGSTDNLSIISQVETLIDADPSDSSYFGPSGFPQDYLPVGHSYDPQSSSIYKSSSTYDSIKITSPAYGQIYNPGDTALINIYSTGEISNFLLVATGNSINIIPIDTTNVPQLKFIIPNNAIGTINFTLLGGDSTGWYATDTTSIIIAPISAPDSIVCNPAMDSVALGLNFTIGIEGYSSGNIFNLVGLSAVQVQYDIFDKFGK